MAAARAVPLLRWRSMSRGVSLCTRPLRLRVFPGVLAALARSLRARIAWGVVGAILREGRGRAAGPPRGVAPDAGVRRAGVRLLAGVGPTLVAWWKGVVGSMDASLSGVGCKSRRGGRRCVLRADSAMAREACERRGGCPGGC